MTRTERSAVYLNTILESTQVKVSKKISNYNQSELQEAALLAQRPRRPPGVLLLREQLQLITPGRKTREADPIFREEPPQSAVFLRPPP